MWYPDVVSGCGVRMWCPDVVSGCGVPLREKKIEISQTGLNLLKARTVCCRMTESRRPIKSTALLADSETSYPKR